MEKFNLMRRAFGTIITLDYLHYALTLNSSLLVYDRDVQFKILISDTTADLSAVSDEFPNVEIIFAEQLCQSGLAKEIYNKYARSNMDCFRWSMKPIFINYLLNHQYDQVFLLDSDLYFFAPYDFLSDELKGSTALLTPHWRSSSPYLDERNFAILQTSGLFNAGFIGVTPDGRTAMNWWAKACAYKCEKQPENGLFVDQGYLDLLPVYFEDIKVVRHRGCNVANWNQVECNRTLTNDGTVKINNEFEIIFIHFTNSTITGIKSGQDYLLRPYLKKYQNSLNDYKSRVCQSGKIQRSISNTASITVSDSPKYIQGNPDKRNKFLNPKLSPQTLDLYTVRHSVFNSIKHHLSEFKGILLDVGCGHMPYRPLVTSPPSRVTDYIGLDLEDNPIHDNRPDITWQNGKIPLKDCSIDCAMATEVFEHCPDPETVMREIYRVLKPGGLLFFTVPFLWPLHEVPYDNYRYTPFSLSRHLTASGFTNVNQLPLGGWNSSLAQMLGLWVRRGPMRGWKRTLMSYLLTPIVYLLFNRDKKTANSFRESMMITGLTGTACKSED